MTFTKERLEEIHAEYSRPNHSKSFSVKDSEIAEMARQLLASMEQEPVYQVLGDGNWTDYSKQQLEDLLESKPSTLFRVAYAAPQLPQPAVPECYQRLLKHAYGMTMGHDWNKGTMAGHHREKLCKAVEDCRAAMLQGAEPVSQHDKLPANVIDALEKALQAMSFMGDTLNALDAVCEEDVEYVTPAFEAVRQVLEGNPPAIPDGWVACSERLPEGMVDVITSNGVDIGKGWWDGDNWKEWDKHDAVPGKITHWMPLPAAPQQEVK